MISELVNGDGYFESSMTKTFVDCCFESLTCLIKLMWTDTEKTDSDSHGIRNYN